MSNQNINNHIYNRNQIQGNNINQIKSISSRNEIKSQFNNTQNLSRNIQNFNQQPIQQNFNQQPIQQNFNQENQYSQNNDILRRQEELKNIPLRGEFYINSEKMDLKLNNKQLDLERINQMSQLDREIGIQSIVSNNNIPLNSTSRNVNIQQDMNRVFNFPQPEYNTRKAYYDNNYNFNSMKQEDTQEKKNTQNQQQVYQQKQQFMHHHQSQIQSNQNMQGNGFAFNREPIAKNIINQYHQGNFLENPQRMNFRPKNNNQQVMNERLENRNPCARNISFLSNNLNNQQNENNENNQKNKQNNHNKNQNSINANYQPSIFMSLPVNTRDDV